MITDLIRTQFPLVFTIVAAIAQRGGRAYLVGGAVRDMVLGLPVTDLDIEVHDLESQQLEAILTQFGPVSLVGKAFGVFRLHGLDIDWSLPRIDSSGRKPTVTIDPYMPLQAAARRRDLTMNAMAIDMVTNELLDPFGGLDDIKNKLLRTPDADFFVEDPLRFYRVMQFIGRFEMVPDDALNSLCKTMDISTISRERIEEEFKKLFLKSRRPSLGIRWIEKIGRLKEVLPELAATIDTPQNSRWHPEGNVYEHSLQALDAAAVIARDNAHKNKYETEYERENDALTLMYAAVCHDLGKVGTTRTIKGEIVSYGHELESEVLGKRMMKRITHNADLIAAVAALVRNHMIPVQLVLCHSKPAAYKRLAHKVHPVTTLRMLADLSLADKRGRNALSHEPLTIDDPNVDSFLAQSAAAQVIESVEQPVLLGRDLVDLVKPGPAMGFLLKKAYEIQIEEGIRDKEELKRRVLKNKKEQG